MCGPIFFRVGASGAMLNGQTLADRDAADRLRSVFEVRSDKTIRVFWEHDLAAGGPGLRERVDAPCRWPAPQA